MKSDMFIEVWKDIKDYEGLYQVSNLGRIRSLDHYSKHHNGGTQFVKGRLLKDCVCGFGYRKVSLCKDGIAKSTNLHSLVAKTFIPNPNNLPEVNHINECKWDNAVWNLEWCTVEYNRSYGNRNTKSKETKQRKYGKPVLQYTLDGQFITEYSCLREASRQTGVNRTNITACCKGVDYQGFNIKQAGGYIWKYK